MILEAIITMFTGFVKFVLGLLPNADAPGWMDSTSSALSTVWGYASGLGAWIPWVFVGNVVAAVLASVVIGFGIKLVRIVASFFTAGGGSAA